ncbi:MAG: L,D-transpeptidase, partial [Collinsella sp.]
TGDIEISYSKKADTITAKGEPDWKAYIDVDLSEQHARYYDENGNIVWEANFISGKPGEDATPEGVWQINSNDGASKLIGAKDPATEKPKYESPVSYWMPFEGNMIGFHDATWQNDKSFDNAESYKWCGSHGLQPATGRRQGTSRLHQSRPVRGCPLVVQRAHSYNVELLRPI